MIWPLLSAHLMCFYMVSYGARMGEENRQFFITLNKRINSCWKKHIKAFKFQAALDFNWTPFFTNRCTNNTLNIIGEFHVLRIFFCRGIAKLLNLTRSIASQSRVL